MKQRLRVRAAGRVRSMEEETREILRRLMAEITPPRDHTAAVGARVVPAARVDLDLPAREEMREPQPFENGGDDPPRHQYAFRVIAVYAGRAGRNMAVCSGR
ncbi:MAG: FitA-like ribbon-helix-helix domain-containing protein [Acidobacteriota bacterium]